MKITIKRNKKSISVRLAAEDQREEPDIQNAVRIARESCGDKPEALSATVTELQRIGYVTVFSQNRTDNWSEYTLSKDPHNG